MTVVITEVIKRAKQGRSAPYVCRGDDGHIYFVKNRSLPRRELVAEYLCAGLAQALELPLAPWCVADVPPELVSTAMGTWMAELGAGPAFASRAVQATELSWHQAQEVDPRLQARVAAFDWWVLNMDRTLTDLGGNPNLLWAADDEQAHLVVIDHNLAFDPGFDARQFLQTHVFRDAFRRLAADFIDREAVRQQLLQAWPTLQEACATMPDDWRYVDPERTMPATWTEAEFQHLLGRCQDDQRFWTLEP